MRIDPLALRLENQQLVRPRFKRPEQVVSWLGAVQAQDYGAATWAIGLRIPGVTSTEVDRAFNDGLILRTHVLRPTWHFVSPADIRWMLTLSAPRVNAASASHHRALKLDAATFSRCHAVLERTLEGGRQLTRPELGVALTRAGIPASGLRLVFLIMHAELAHVICSGARRGKQITYALLAERVQATDSPTPEEALADLTRRYFESHGPAALSDFAWWSGLTVRHARTGVALLGRSLVRESIDGCDYWFALSRQHAARRRPTAWLLPTFDEFLVAYKDRSLVSGATPATLNPYQHHVILNGRRAGHWRAIPGRGALTVQATLYRRPSAADARALSAAVRHYSRFTGMPVGWEPSVSR